MAKITVQAIVRKRGAIGVFHSKDFTIESSATSPERGAVVEDFIRQHGDMWELSHIRDWSPNPYTNFGDIARGQMGMQCQYAVRYFDERFKASGYPYLGDGVRFDGKFEDYHSLRIHKDDVETAVKRYKEQNA